MQATGQASTQSAIPSQTSVTMECAMEHLLICRILRIDPIQLHVPLCLRKLFSRLP